MAKNTAKFAPNLPKKRPVEDLTAELHQTLREQFCLEPIPTYSVFVEGWTDRYYLERAAQLVLEHDGEDLLKVTLPDGNIDRIAILTPGIPGNPSRGGVPQLVRLARVLEGHVFTLDLYAVCFLFDHDKAGFDGRNEICDRYYLPEVHAITLNDSAKGKHQYVEKDKMVVEDLLPLELQTQFFEQSNDKWCTVTYESGLIRRFQWDGESKGKVQVFACKKGSREDFRHVINVLYRIRTALSLPISGSRPE